MPISRQGLGPAFKFYGFPGTQNLWEALGCDLKWPLGDIDFCCGFRGGEQYMAGMWLLALSRTQIEAAFVGPEIQDGIFPPATAGWLA